MQTVYEFELPKGIVDEKGQVHKKGKMRLAYLYSLLYIFNQSDITAPCSLRQFIHDRELLPFDPGNRTLEFKKDFALNKRRIYRLQQIFL